MVPRPWENICEDEGVKSPKSKQLASSFTSTNKQGIILCNSGINTSVQKKKSKTLTGLGIKPTTFQIPLGCSNH